MSTAAAPGLHAAPRGGKEWRALALVVGGFLLAFYLPVEMLEGLWTGSSRLESALAESLYLTRSYAREHVITCLIPAFFIAGAIGVFVSQGAVMRYLGPRANKILAYGVASVSGSMLAVCSCTVLPLFAGIYAMGAGLGPASAFLYAGPAINVLAIIFTARVLGVEIGTARAVGAVAFAIVIGLLMHLIFRREEAEKAAAAGGMTAPEDGRPLWQSALFFLTLVGILVFANWGRPDQPGGLWAAIYGAKWAITAGFALALAVLLSLWFGIRVRAVAVAAAGTAALAVLFPDRPLIPFAAGTVALAALTMRGGEEASEWFDASWGFAKQILPLLLIGVLIAGALLGRPGHEALVPSDWVSAAVGGNSVGSNLFASVAGAFMYFATLTEVPILDGLLGSGMGYGPALALLLAGPALSLPNMLVIRSVVGTKKTIVYLTLVGVMSAVAGLMFGGFYR